MMMISFGAAFLLSLGLIPLNRWLSFKLGRVDKPREDRWHRKPTPKMGGIAIFFATLLAILLAAWVNGEWNNISWGLLGGSVGVFLLGVYDDLKQITPPAKLLGLILAASLVVFLGYTTNFFTPKIPDSILAQLPNILLTFVWLVGISNAINLLDNMDGLAGGISLIAAGFLSYFFWRSGDLGSFYISMALTGSLLGFLIYNFPPASIFMGDSGSLFLGFTLAVLAIARQPQASNVFAVMGVPTLLFLLPILDTAFVTFTRLLRGQSPAQGGRDHTSHRLIAFGLTERQTLLVLYGVAILSGIAGIALETLDYWLSLVFVPILVVSLALLAAYLARVKVLVNPAPSQTGVFTRLMVELTYKRRSLEIILDFFLIAIAYYLAFWTSNNLSINETTMQLFLKSLPVALVGAYISFYVFGVYRGVWRYVGIENLIGYAKSTLGSVALVAGAVYLLYPQSGYVPVIFLFFGVFLLLGLTASRSSFKILDLVYGQKTITGEKRVLIVGAGDSGEMAVRWILMNPKLGYRPVGFVDDNPYNAGRQIHGIGILGEIGQLETLLKNRQIEGVLLTTDERISGDALERIRVVCHAHGCWVRTMRLEFELVE
jgi:UDP-GlcNAc:undecaprenyl-phosphate GlcNAc-1-phosphate transferase